MLRVTIELVPNGIEAARRIIAQAVIGRVAMGEDAIGTYVAQLECDRGTEAWSQVQHPYAEGVWSLVGRIITQADDDPAVVIDPRRREQLAAAISRGRPPWRRFPNGSPIDRIGG